MILHILPCLLLACTLSAQDLQSFLAPNLADGFDFPVGDADGKAGYQDQGTKRRYKNWIVKESVVDALGLEAQETWNGSGGGKTAANQPVHALAAGTVTELKNDEVWLEHRFLENGQPQHIQIGFAGIHACNLKPVAWDRQITSVM